MTRKSISSSVSALIHDDDTGCASGHSVLDFGLEGAGPATDQSRKATFEFIEVGGFAAAGRSEWRSLGKPDTHRTQSRRHIARIGVGQGPKTGGSGWLLPPVREAHKQDRRHSLLEEGELEFFKVNAIARLFQRLGHILCGTIVAEGAGGSVATTLRGDALQHSQMPEGALACRCVEQGGGKSAIDDIFRPGHAAWCDCSKERGREANAPACTKGL